jgi:hypothetical protein
VSIAQQAVSAQTSGGYSGDVWFNVRLEPMTKVWQGIGGYSNFFLSEHDAREARGSYVGTTPYKFAETLWRLAQVQPNVVHGYRLGIREFVVDLPTPAAFSVCVSNVRFGSGGVFQYYIPDWERTLYPTGREFKFGAASFSQVF